MLSCFKSYDVRGRLGTELTEEICVAIGRAFARVMDPGTVVTGRDIRASSEGLQAALHRGLVDEGVQVIDIGLCGTEEVYFATPHYEAGGGLMVTASHNPMDYNGIKMVRAGARPISADTGLAEIQALAEAGDFGPARPGGQVSQRDPRPDYVAHLMGYVAPADLGPLRIVVNAGNGAAGPTLDALLSALRGAPLDVVKINHDADGSFPNGIPNPLLPENRAATAEAVVAHGADMGVAWDGDFDRCFFFDETGAFVDGEYVVTLLAKAFCAKEPGAGIVYDPRVIWATEDAVRQAGGTPILSRVGHSHIKGIMRDRDAAYGGEMSAHHYFRDFNYCDSGMIPWLLLAELVARSGRPLSGMLAELRRNFPSSGEVNFRIGDVDEAVAAFEATHGPQARAEDRLDGISYDMGDWRVNLRRSNTEPVVRLNVEARDDSALVADKLSEIRNLLAAYAV
ncbi:phosphomannomutase [Salibaculum halophilum]|uniref:phosphomannomutase n=1 Tax=Salibaculum halophilum TaxID=1914408 RepID=UPI000A0FDD10|nr:phosphomannomutase [Salibaculum halophilum]